MPPNTSRTHAEQGASAAVLELRDVARSYGGVPVLGPVGLTVHKGRCVVVTGGNGSGKSTLLRLAAGRERPTKGTVRLDGAEMDGDRRQVRSAVATVIDTDAFYPDLTVREHLMLVALAHGGGGAAPETVSAALAAHHLTDRAEVPPSALSSGQRQQMLLAAAFVRPHRLLILDEPEQRLDAGARRELAARLVRHKAHGVALLVATHHAPLVAALADRVVRLGDDGQEDPPDPEGPAGGGAGEDDAAGEASGGDDADRGGGGREAAAGDRG
ncbi:ABC transporter ATP-binding protein [Streptomyces zhihengii]|uniref:ABC transporter ATP-binding protein n=1 Tax=Streptomyces zhihengii TaxID=1818004 RepID=A0ABS2V1I9_9ACTN|nr:ABC transporter ATP-binding protein [Streptomyces zhihengii]MBM9623704.1 ABC transporter ATP-binding protein [Streptomyces zhihengii]